MKKDLYYKLLNILTENNKYVTLSFLSNELGVSSKTVRNYLSDKEFLSLIYPCTLDKKPHNGIKLVGTKDEILKLKRLVFDNNICDVQDEEYETKHILNVLFRSKDACAGKILADELYKSRGSINKNIEFIKKYLNKFNIDMKTKENVGIWIEGDESNIRDAYKNFICEDLEKNININKSKIIKNNFNYIDFISKHFSNLNIDNILNSISYSEKIIGNKFTENDRIIILIKISILIERLLINKTISNNNIKLKDTKEYLAAEIIRLNLERDYPINIGLDEVFEISEYILSARSQKETLFEDNYFDISIIKKFLNRVSDFLDIKLDKDETLINNLTLHIRPAIRRLKYGVTSENPLLKDIRYEYSDIYLAVLTSIEEIEKEENIAFDINEIGYICLHIVAAINRNKKGKYIKACIICDGGVTITKYIESIISSEIKEIYIERSITSSELEDDILNSYDVLIDTTSNTYSRYINNMIKIKSIVDENDISIIHHWILNRQISFNTSQNTNFKDTVFLFDDDCENQEKLILKYGNYLEESSYVREGFVKSIFEREKKASTLIGKGIAVPHGYREYVKKSVMLIIRLKNKILWGSEYVDMVFLLAINFDYEDENKKIFRKLYHIIGDSEKLYKLKNAEDIKTIKMLFFDDNKEVRKMRLSEIVCEENINLSLEAVDKKDAFIKTAEIFYKNGIISNVNDYVNAVVKREEEFSTGIGYGLAIPHAKCSAVKKPAVAIVRLKNDIEYKSFDDEPIRMLFMIAVLEQGADEHIKILSTLSRKFMHEEFRNALKGAETASDIISVLNEI